MKKIKSDKQLNSEKRRLQKRQQELESLIHANWIELKQRLKPSNLAGNILSRTFTSTDENNNSLLAESLGQFAAALTKSAVEKAEEKFSEWLKNR